MVSMLSTLVNFLFAFFIGIASGKKQCGGGAPMESIKTYLNATLDYEVADWICCNNHRYAEKKGYLASPEVDLFGRLDPNETTVFYDSVCGIPLFIAPRGRTFEEFKEDSLYHGWPSFTPDEIVSENVIMHFTGRMESKCGTHLGHNLPKNGEDRYCIDLVCIAGEPSQARSFDDGILVGSSFVADTYTSSASKSSGRNSTNVFLGCFFGLASVVFLVSYFGIKRYKSKRSTIQTSYGSTMSS